MVYPDRENMNGVTKEGKKVFIKGSYSIIKDRVGIPTRILMLASDITDHIPEGITKREAGPRNQVIITVTGKLLNR